MASQAGNSGITEPAELTRDSAAEAWTDARLRLALDAARVGTWDWDIASGRVHWSPLVESIFGLESGSFRGTFEAYVALLHPEDRETVQRALASTLAGDRGDYSIEHRIRTADGSVRWIEGKGRLYRDADGKPQRMMGTVVDISQRKHAEDALRHVEDIFRTVVEDQTEMIVRWQPDGTRTFVNQAYCRRFGESHEDLVGTNLLPAGPERAALLARIAAITPACPVSIDIHQSVLPNGSLCWHEWTDRGFFNAAGTLVALQSVGRDVSERVRAERSLAASEAVLRQFIRHTPAAVAMLDNDLRYLQASDRWLKDYNLGDQDLTGRLHYEVFPDIPERWKEIHRRVLAGSVERCDEDPFPRADGSLDWLQWEMRPWFRADGSIGGAIMFTQVITQRKAAEAAQEQLRHAQKLDTVGRLAGGVAHDFNNLLAVILGELELLALGLSRGEDPDAHIRAAMAAGESAAALTRQLLLFARKQPASPTALDVNEVVMRTHRMLQRVIGEDVTLDVRIDHALPSVWMDRGQLEQVLLNLAVNAKDAMSSGGCLTIETQTVSTLSPKLAQHGGDSDRPFAKLSVSDTGVGIDAAVLPRIFEPFFTTKNVGKGTGIGLATVEDVVRGAGGFIDVASTLGQGTRFDIYLPSSDVKAPESGSLREEAPAGRGELVVLVEDQPAVREVVCSQLALLGYEVLSFASGEEAAAALGHDLKRVDLLMTDVVMSGMDGPTLVETLRRARSDLRVLYMSGYTDEVVLARGLGMQLSSLLRKPFPLHDLAHALRYVLEPGFSRPAEIVGSRDRRE